MVPAATMTLSKASCWALRKRGCLRRRLRALGHRESVIARSQRVVTRDYESVFRNSDYSHVERRAAALELTNGPICGVSNRRVHHAVRDPENGRNCVSPLFPMAMATFRSSPECLARLTGEPRKRLTKFVEAKALRATPTLG